MSNQEKTTPDAPAADESENDSADAVDNVVALSPANPAAFKVGQLEPVENPGEADTEKTAGAENDQTDADDGQDDGTTAHDGEAPYGRFANGNPRKRPTSAGAKDERTKQRTRLRSVTQSTHKLPQKLPTSGSTVVPALAIVNHQAMGETVASMFFSIGELAVGPDWAPDKPAGEHVAVAGAFRDYFKATNMRDLPPGFALVLVLTVYGMKRVNKPTVKEKMQGVGLWLKSKMPRRRGFIQAA